MVKANSYFAIILDDENLLISEPLEEILRERYFHYKKNGLFFDCWILPNPKFLDNFEKIENKSKKVAILSCNKSLILILKSRLASQVQYLHFEAPSSNIPSPLLFQF